MARIIVLGCGMVGSAIARDLSTAHDVSAADMNTGALQKLNKLYGIETKQVDLSDGTVIRKIVQDYDLIVTAVPGFMGFKVLKDCIKAGKNVSDISFFPENCLELNDLAKENGVCVISDVGVAPGMDNLILGHHSTTMKVDNFTCLVGGLPVKRQYPFEYKAPFSPVDVIEEYTRPARLVVNGSVQTREPLTDAEYINFDSVGTLEAFNTDGLRSLIFTMKDIPNMKEKTLRYPGHIALIKALKAGGFFSDQEITVNGKTVKPVDFSSSVLRKAWKLGEKEQEFTVMRVIVEGVEEGQRKRHCYNMIDYYDPDSGVSSMSRTTGYTCTAAAHLILEGHFTTPGVHPPELVGRDNTCFQFVLDYLADRGIHYKHTTTVLDGQ